MILILRKPTKMIPMNEAERSATEHSVFHRDFLGAHRYTTGGGTARPAGGVLPVFQGFIAIYVCFF